MKTIRANVRFILAFGLIRWYRYEKMRRAGVTIDYSKIFTPDEMALLEEHMETVPWHR